MLSLAKLEQLSFRFSEELPWASEVRIVFQAFNHVVDILLSPG
jgi:hypothetical protein